MLNLFSLLLRFELRQYDSSPIQEFNHLMFSFMTTEQMLINQVTEDGRFKDQYIDEMLKYKCIMYNV